MVKIVNIFGMLCLLNNGVSAGSISMSKFLNLHAENLTPAGGPCLVDAHCQSDCCVRIVNAQGILGEEVCAVNDLLCEGRDSLRITWIIELIIISILLFSVFCLYRSHSIKSAEVRRLNLRLSKYKDKLKEVLPKD